MSYIVTILLAMTGFFSGLLIGRLNQFTFYIIVSLGLAGMTLLGGFGLLLALFNTDRDITVSKNPVASLNILSIGRLNNIKTTTCSCKSCQGSGRVKFLRVLLKQCIVCGGSGSIIVPSPPRKCAWCHGKGWYSSIKILPNSLCKVCLGSGWKIIQPGNKLL